MVLAQTSLTWTLTGEHLLRWPRCHISLHDRVLTYRREYPQADDRGGQADNTANYVSLARELKAAIGSKGISMTLPTSYWYLQHFDVKSLQQYVDWFNFMAYDLHGTWGMYTGHPDWALRSSSFFTVQSQHIAH